MKTEKPILFSTPMVQAILAERKTQTRRFLKNSFGFDENWKITKEEGEYYSLRCGSKYALPFFKPKYKLDDILWVRETWALPIDRSGNDIGYQFKADYTDNSNTWKWKPSIFMPKEACRIRLKVTAIRAELLHKISGEDALKEGVLVKSNWPLCIGEAYWEYATLWDKINGKGAWGSNPYVWVYDFERVM